MTAFDELERGDIIWGTDPLSDKGRPMLVLGTPRFPNHGIQLITVLISTKAYHEESLTLRDDDYDGDPLGERSHVLPWSLATLNSAVEVKLYMTSLTDERTADVAAQSIGYISS
ncbi:PemK-like protein [Natrinema sp. SYSU A 869]|uniref:PemK-like protein n=1 Tax=Natrinema sp. SYSU A 869 TaxID=2871694 RepID=UPI001CA3BB5D|nr:PemK-like protein [Natrinema sp. SYSU A 869]